MKSLITFGKVFVFTEDEKKTGKLATSSGRESCITFANAITYFEAECSRLMAKGKILGTATGYWYDETSCVLRTRFEIIPYSHQPKRDEPCRRPYILRQRLYRSFDTHLT